MGEVPKYRNPAIAYLRITAHLARDPVAHEERIIAEAERYAAQLSRMPQPWRALVESINDEGYRLVMGDATTQTSAA